MNFCLGRPNGGSWTDTVHKRRVFWWTGSRYPQTTCGLGVCSGRSCLRRYDSPVERVVRAAAVFAWVSKVVRVSLVLHYCAWWLVKRNSRHFLSQSEENPKPIATQSCLFSRASRRLHVFTSTCDWFTGLSVFLGDWPKWLLWYLFFRPSIFLPMQ